LRISNIYNQNLKNYSLAVEYAERALKLIEEGQRLGAEKYPDAYFFPEVNEDAKEIYGGDEWARKTKIDWYQRQKSMAYSYLWAEYKSIGDAKTAELYRQKMMKEVKPAEEAQKEHALRQEEMMDKQKAHLETKLGEPASRRFDEVQKQMAESLRMAAEKTRLIGDFMARMEEQAARGDQSGLRESIKAYIKASFAEYYEAPEGTAQWAAIGIIKFPLAADLSYRYGLYPDALDYSLNAMTAMRAWLEHGRQTAKQAFFESDGRRIMEHREAGISVGYIKSQLIAGSSLSRLGRYRDAIPYLRGAYEHREAGTGVLWGVSSQEELPKMEALYELTGTYERAGMNAEAIKACGEMIDYFESVRARMTREAHKVSFMGKQHEIYDRMIDLLLKDGRAGEALAYAERARARSFVDLLSGKELKAKDPRTQGLLTEKRAAEREFASLDEKVAGDPSRERSVQIVKKMDGLSREIEQRDIELASLTTVKTLSTKEIQAMLDHDTALVEYYVTRKGITAWVVTSDTVTFKRIDIPIFVLAQKIIEFRARIEDQSERPERAESLKAASRVRLEITPKRFRYGEEIAYRVYAKNNLPLFLSIEEVKTRSGNWAYVTKDVMEKEVPGGEEKMVYGRSGKWKITPGTHQVILRTDQGDLASNTMEVRVDGQNMATIVDKGYPEGESRISGEVEKYSQLSLYDVLIKSVAPTLNKKKVGIIPHGILHYVPFAALADGRHYLIEKYTLFYLPSATVLKFCKDKRKAFTGKILAIGNPDLKNKDLDIPFAVDEVKTIRSFYPESALLIRAEATKSAFQSRCGSYNTIHLATHGIFDPNRPFNSALLLSPTDGDNGRLTASEIFDLDLDVSLVVLSACQSGMSRVRAGDEMMGIPRAFIYAGSPSVVASLWNVNDEATAVLMGKFYENLKTMEKAESLKLAQLYLLQNAKYRVPYYWAAFSLTGDYK